MQLKGITENRPRVVDLCGDSTNSLVLQAFGWSARAQCNCEVNEPHWLMEKYSPETDGYITFQFDEEIKNKTVIESINILVATPK